jgi:hypothetical protein
MINEYQQRRYGNHKTLCHLIAVSIYVTSSLIVFLYYVTNQTHPHTELFYGDVHLYMYV